MTEDAFAEWIDEMLTEHAEHPWRQIGRCVYCGPCGTRLYQGSIPEGHPVDLPRIKDQGPSMLSEFRSRWGID